MSSDALLVICFERSSPKPRTLVLLLIIPPPPSFLGATASGPRTERARGTARARRGPGTTGRTSPDPQSGALPGNSRDTRWTWASGDQRYAGWAARAVCSENLTTPTCRVGNNSALSCYVLSCSSKARGGSPGTLVGLGVLAAAVCRAGGPGCLFLKSNDPNLSGGEQVCYVMICYAMLCSVVLCSVMRCSVVFCDVLSCSVLSCHVVSCSVLACFVMLCGVLSCHVLSCSAPF